MKRLIYTFLALCFFGLNVSAQDYSEQERRKIIQDFEKHIEKTRDRIDRMQEKGKLSQTQYMEEEAVIRDAEQDLELLREGNYVEKSKIEEWKNKLSRLGVDPEREAEGVQYNNKEKGKGRAKGKGEGRTFGQNTAAEARMKNSINRSNEITKRGDDVISVNTERIEKAKQKVEQQRKDGTITNKEYHEKMNKIRLAEERIQQLRDNLDQHREVISDISGDQ